MRWQGSLRAFRRGRRSQVGSCSQYARLYPAFLANKDIECLLSARLAQFFSVLLCPCWKAQGMALLVFQGLSKGILSPELKASIKEEDLFVAES